MSTAVATLPTGSDPAAWSEEEKALVSAAGLVHTDTNGAQTPAPRPVVAAFLQHCARTGLDPFARQIYAIARKNRGNLAWTVQISIDGARLIAERTGEYEGQTTPEFTSNGTDWTQVWLSDEQPKAARVGVFRRGFREPLYAIALWDAYAVYQDEWVRGEKTGNQKLSAMWAKMGPLMLAKCAEMLALRKAFPQDLSGLYSTEEMDQAGGPREVVKQAEAPVQPMVAERSAPVIATPVATRDWAAEIGAAKSLDECSALYREAEAAGELGVVVGMAGDKDDGSANTVMDLFWARKRDLQEQETPPLVDVAPTKSGRRLWQREARSMRSRDEVRALYLEAKAAGVSEGVLDELTAIERTLPDPDAAAPASAGEWAEPVAGADGWVESEPGVFVEADTPAVLDDATEYTARELSGGNA